MKVVNFTHTDTTSKVGTKDFIVGVDVVAVYFVFSKIVRLNVNSIRKVEVNNFVKKIRVKVGMKNDKANLSIWVMFVVNIVYGIVVVMDFLADKMCVNYRTFLLVHSIIVFIMLVIVDTNLNEKNIVQNVGI